jgi:DNA-binding MarR family transcriptional regulator
VKKTLANKEDHPTGGLTLAEYAKTKQVPVNFLKSLGLGDMHLGGTPVVRVPYLNQQGEEVAVRFRLSMSKDEVRFKWRSGSKPCFYGLRRLEDAREAGHITLVEGESDAHTLWFQREPALGLPGADSWNEAWAPHLDGIDIVYVVVEPDKGGAAVLKWLADSAIRDRVRLVKLKGVKDPSELYLKNPKGFRTAWDKAIEASQPWSELEDAQTKEKIETLWQECKDLAGEENILSRFAEALVERGATGVSQRGMFLYLALTSRVLDRIVSAGLKGPSSGGKSYLLDSVLAFFPPEAYYVLTAMSDKALAYSDEPLRHRFVVLYEASALGSEWAAYFVRSLMSEGRIVYETVEKTPEGMRARRIEREGPTGLLTTTTAINLHAENETRYFSIRISDSPEQTKRIVQAEALKVSGTAVTPVDGEVFFRKWRALQTWLAHAEHRVVVPFAPAVAELLPPVAVRLRRDFSAVLSLVQAHAVLHQATRGRDDQGRIVATLGDYDQVRHLVQGLMAEATERKVPETLRQTRRVVAEICALEREPSSEGKASIKEVAEKLHLDRSAASRRIQDCIERGFLETTEPIKKGTRIWLQLGEALPDDEELLPSVEKVREHWKEKGRGKNHEPPPTSRGGKPRANERAA